MEIHSKFLFLVKNGLSQKEAQIYSERLLFSTSLIGENPVENLVLVNITVIDQSRKKGPVLTKTVFHHKMSHIKINYAFLFF